MPIPPGLLTVFKTPSGFIALGFGAGLAPLAPGTAATIAAVPLYLVLAGLPAAAYLICVVLVFILGVQVCDRVNKHFHEHDHGAIVWDEIVGFLVTMALVPVSIVTVVAGVILFRLFDILKPWPIGWLDRQLSGGFGIMVDDALAGLAANACLRLIFVLWLSFYNA